MLKMGSGILDIYSSSYNPIGIDFVAIAVKMNMERLVK